MWKTRTFLILISIAFVSLLGSAFYQESKVRDLRAEQKSEIERQIRVETAEISGFDHVVNAREGETVTITGFIDIKFLCRDVSSEQREICTTAVSASQPERSMLIKLKVCSIQITKNCIVWDWDHKNGVDFRNVHVIDDDGQNIDFDGHVLIAEPNTWTANPAELKLSGQVSRMTGIGRILTPIERIESAN